MNLTLNPYAGQHYTGSIVVTYNEAENGTPPDVKIETDRLEMVPITDDDRIVQFYTENLQGNALTMAKYADCRQRTPEEISQRVHTLANRWKDGESFSAFVVSDRETNELLGHAIFGRGDLPGESEYSVMIRPTHEDGSSAWNVGYGKEVTYAMYHGLVPKYAALGLKVVDDETKLSHEVTIMLATSRHDNHEHKTLARLHEGDSTHAAKTHESERWGATRTHFYTTPQAMKEMRERLVKEK